MDAKIEGEGWAVALEWVAISFAVLVVLFTAGIVWDARLVLADPLTRIKALGPLLTGVALAISVVAIAHGNRVRRREERRRANVATIELSGLAEGQSIEATVLPGGEVRISGVAKAAEPPKVVRLVPKAEQPSTAVGNS